MFAQDLTLLNNQQVQIVDTFSPQRTEKLLDLAKIRINELRIIGRIFLGSNSKC